MDDRLTGADARMCAYPSAQHERGCARPRARICAGGMGDARAQTSARASAITNLRGTLDEDMDR